MSKIEELMDQFTKDVLYHDIWIVYRKAVIDYVNGIEKELNNLKAKIEDEHGEL